MPSSACQTCALRSEEHTSELQSQSHLVCRLLLEKKKARPGRTCRPSSRIRSATRPTGSVSAACTASDPPHRRTEAVEPPAVLGVLAFFFKDPAPPEIYPLPLHDALPISARAASRHRRRRHPPPPPPRSRRSRGGGIGREHVCNPITLPPPFPLSVLI